MPTAPPFRRTAPSTGRARSWPAVVLGLALAAGTGLMALPDATASVPTVPGWTQVWADDFTGSAGSGVNTGNWMYDIGNCYPGCPAGNWGTGEIAYHTSSTQNVYHDGNGNLAIRPIRDGAGNWTSGRIETQRTNFAAPPGGVMRIEGRIAMPNLTGAAAQGYWPAFWALGSGFRGVYTNWPGIGELDIMENVNGANTVWGTLHCGYSPGGPCNETTGLGGSRACPGAPCQGNFHTYAIEYDKSTSPEQLRWYVDGQNYFTLRADQLDAATWNNAVNHGFFIILNVAIGGGWPGNPTGSTASGVPMLVDYVGVWTRGGGTGGTTTTTTARTTTTTTGGGGTGAYATIQAESYSAQSGSQLEATSDSGGGSNVGYLANGDWLQYDNVDFGSTAARNFQARLASGVGGGASGLVEVRLDSRSSAPIGSIAIGNTGGWQSWRTVPANISAVTGRHTVFLTFTSGQASDFVNVNWFTFLR